MSVDVDGNVYFSDKYIKSIPVKFRKVDGNFWCGDNQLITLIGSPKIVKGGFYCSGNQLRSLACSPKIVEGDFWCHNNKLINLTGVPKAVKGNLVCFGNPLISLFELNACAFNGYVNFNIDENKIKQKNLVKMLKKYHKVTDGHYRLTFNEFCDKIKPTLEKDILENFLTQGSVEQNSVKLESKKTFI